MGIAGWGRERGKTAEQSVAIVRRAMELGINFIDTAEVYGTEALVGEGIAGARRDGLVLSTKKSMSKDGKLITASDLVQGLEESLKRLKTDRVEVYHLHGVSAKDYPYAREHAGAGDAEAEGAGEDPVHGDHGGVRIRPGACDDVGGGEG